MRLIKFRLASIELEGLPTITTPTYMLRSFATASRKMAPIAAADIPSLGLLYKLKKLDKAQTTPVAGASPSTTTALALSAATSPPWPSTPSAKITDAYNLPCKKVIHTVGPVYDDLRPERSEAALRGCYRSSLELTVQHGLKTIAFSGISTGVYGYPSLDACQVACDTVKQFLDQNAKKLDKVVFVTFEAKDVRSYDSTLPLYFPPDTETSVDQEKAAEDQAAEAKATASKLPDVPTTDPAEADPDHAQKKQKQDGEP
ncbi:MACRO domain-containing protein [Apiospora rasikravindrae]|uniref:MACRO domain-containing protein n=1 Tax=Apiospora rasikravindrae TaxID=990691 RepID=A0ABR1U083_9PEZI